MSSLDGYVRNINVAIIIIIYYYVCGFKTPYFYPLRSRNEKKSCRIIIDDENILGRCEMNATRNEGDKSRFKAAVPRPMTCKNIGYDLTALLYYTSLTVVAPYRTYITAGRILLYHWQHHCIRVMYKCWREWLIAIFSVFRGLFNLHSFVVRTFFIFQTDVITDRITNKKKGG